MQLLDLCTKAKQCKKKYVAYNVCELACHSRKSTLRLQALHCKHITRDTIENWILLESDWRKESPEEISIRLNCELNVLRHVYATEQVATFYLNNITSSVWQWSWMILPFWDICGFYSVSWFFFMFWKWYTVQSNCLQSFSLFYASHENILRKWLASYHMPDASMLNTQYQGHEGYVLKTLSGMNL